MANINCARRCLFFLSLICLSTYQSCSQATNGSGHSDSEGKNKDVITYLEAVEQWQHYNCSFPDPTTYKATEPLLPGAESQTPLVLHACADPQINQIGQNENLLSHPDLIFRKQLCSGFYLVSIQICRLSSTSLIEKDVISSSYYRESTHLCLYATQLSKYPGVSNLMNFLTKENSCSSYCKNELLPVCQRYIAMLCMYAERQGQKTCVPPPSVASLAGVPEHEKDTVLAEKTVVPQVTNNAVATNAVGSKTAPNDVIKDAAAVKDSQKEIPVPQENNLFESGSQDGKAVPAVESTPNNQPTLSQSNLSTPPTLPGARLSSQTSQNAQGIEGTLNKAVMQSDQSASKDQLGQSIGKVKVEEAGKGVQNPTGSQNTTPIRDLNMQQNGQGVPGQQGGPPSNTEQQGEGKGVQNPTGSQNANPILDSNMQQNGQGVPGQQGGPPSNTEQQGEAKGVQNPSGNQNANPISDSNRQQNGQGVPGQQGGPPSNTEQQGEAKGVQNPMGSQNANPIPDSNMQQNGQGVPGQQGGPPSNTEQGEAKDVQNPTGSQNANSILDSNMQQNGQGVPGQQGGPPSNTEQQGEAKGVQNPTGSQNANPILDSNMQQNGQGVPGQQGGPPSNTEQQGEAKDVQNPTGSQNANSVPDLHKQQSLPVQQDGQSNNNEQGVGEVGDLKGQETTLSPWGTQNGLFPQQQAGQEPFNPSRQRPAESWGQNSQNNVQNSQQLPTYKENNQDVPSSGHFFAYFLTAVVICISGYVIFHNKQKIIAFVVEGRNGTGSGRRRGNGGVQYTQLQSNVEEVMPSLEKAAATKNFVY